MSKVLRSIALQTDGKIVAAGNWDARFYLTRFDTDGSVDSSFGDNGTVITGGGIDAMSVAVTPEGRILATGYGSGMSSTSAVYEPSGALHALAHRYYKSYNVSKDVSNTKDGGILVSTYTTNFPADGRNAAEAIGISKYKNNAELWSATVGNNIPNDWTFAREKTDTKILVAATIATTGLPFDNGTDWNAIAYQLNSDGSQDTSFGSNGTAIISYAGRERVRSIELDPSDKPYFIGYIDLDANPGGPYPTENTDFYASSLLANGKLNTAFGGGDGVVTIDFGGKDVAQASAIQNDNKLILAGMTNTTGKEALALARLNTNGSLDSTFGNKGSVVVSGLDKNAVWFEVTDVIVNYAGDVIALFTTGNASASIAFDKAGIIKSGYIIGSDSSDDFQTTDVSDKLFGLNGDDVLNGGKGDDYIDGGTGNDQIIGGEGIDTAAYADAKNGVRIDLQAGSAGSLQSNAEIGTDTLSDIENIVASDYRDIILGSSENNVIDSGDGNDEITTADGDDTVYAGLGDDLIIGGDGKGNDKYYGGAGSDVVRYTSANWGITVDLARGTAASLSNPALRGNRDAANIGVDKLYEIENVIAGNFNDVLSGNQLANEIMGEDGDDSIDGRAGNDVLYGGAGNDNLTGGTGADVMAGGVGDDVYEVDTLADVVTELAGQGRDTILTQLSSYTLGSHIENLTYTGRLNSTLMGNELDNHITGSRGADRLDGGAGNDLIYGGDGNDWMEHVNDPFDPAYSPGVDTYYGGRGNDAYIIDELGASIVENRNEGTDSIYTQLDHFVLAENVENLIHDRDWGVVNFTGRGNSLANLIQSSAGNDSLSGAAGNDTLLGDAGDDYLNGGAGRDRLTGGSGADKFVFDTTPNSRTNADIITDFRSSHGDKLGFDDSVFTMLRGGVTTANLRINMTGRAQDTDDYLILNSTNGKLFYDADGNGRGTAITIATLTDVNTLSHHDFFII